MRFSTVAAFLISAGLFGGITYAYGPGQATTGGLNVSQANGLYVRKPTDTTTTLTATKTMTADKFVSTSNGDHGVADGGANFVCNANPAQSSPCLASFTGPLELGGEVANVAGTDANLYLGAMAQCRTAGPILTVLNGYGGYCAGGAEQPAFRVMVDGIEVYDHNERGNSRGQFGGYTISSGYDPIYFNVDGGNMAWIDGLGIWSQYPLPRASFPACTLGGRLAYDATNGSYAYCNAVGWQQLSGHGSVSGMGYEPASANPGASIPGNSNTDISCTQATNNLPGGAPVAFGAAVMQDNKGDGGTFTLVLRDFTSAKNLVSVSGFACNTIIGQQYSGQGFTDAGISAGDLLCVRFSGSCSGNAPIMNMSANW